MGKPEKIGKYVQQILDADDPQALSRQGTTQSARAAGDNAASIAAPAKNTADSSFIFFFFLYCERTIYTRALVTPFYYRTTVRVVLESLRISEKENLISRTCARFHAMCVPTSTNLSHKEGGLHITSYSGYYTSQSNGDCSATG